MSGLWLVFAHCLALWGDDEKKVTGGPAQRVVHAGPGHSVKEGDQQRSGVCEPMQFIAVAAL
jgi:hypothetical protein